ncbi:cell division protein FtsA [Alkalihalobacillus pseudalcaliphilus]|uniref:cell division protein FtsA n=1 Tax=Alkalihalobacillus pseudalcaliphilus TaxID=79884 RepID=UPI00064D8CD5|nr:pilus assembly protein PilM [Alkalihalobacillus pseudalcaliphilus]KMK77813.1 cell division protein [Alkalihalobacillus pseudalcaliphilus]
MDERKQSPLFALDIGTRSVVGLLLQPKDEQFQLINMEIIEHKERSMLDGQIHDIPAVATVIQQVKEKLEERHGTLERVCVAAAGRSLKTKRATYSYELTGKQMLTQEDVMHMELSAVQKAQFELARIEEKEDSLHYFCVGYSVIHYQIDGEVIGSLIDQNGAEATVEVIATFLPKIVVESLIQALSRAELELEALTLEPIAAINVLIPSSMRRLNVALVDIGAGTSDIAITDENTVVAYGMVPCAGDEITEAISDHFLLDFQEAETVKRQIRSNEPISIHDILGFETQYKADEIIQAIRSPIRQLAKKISDEILELNGRPPKAVMLVGGGSLTPELTTHVADQLRLPRNRVAIRGIDAIQKLDRDHLPANIGPELVTPIGIAIAAKENPIEYLSVSVNEQKLRLFDIKHLTVGDALLSAGVEISKLYGKPGLAQFITIDHKKMTIPGELGEIPTLMKNNHITTLQDPIYANDKIVVKRGNDGKKAVVTIEEMYGGTPNYPLLVNGEKVNIPGAFTLHNQVLPAHYVLQDGDSISITYPKTIADILQALNMEPHFFEKLQIKINGKSHRLLYHGYELRCNGQLADLYTPVKAFDHLMIPKDLHEVTWTLANVCQHLNVDVKKQLTLYFNGQKTVLTKDINQFFRGNEKLEATSLLYPNDDLTLQEIPDTPFILQDIFAVIDIDTAPMQNRKIEIRKNGIETGFAETVYEGDEISLTIT